ncbi:MAG: RidA family protein [Chloroflexota bacterium]
MDMDPLSLHHINPSTVAQPDGPYTEAIVCNGFVFVSGQASIDASGQVVGRGDVRAQAKQAIGNLQQVLVASGSDLDRVVKLTWYLTHIDDRGAIAEVRRQFWKDRYPTSTLVEVKGLALPDLRIEVEAIAAVISPGGA